MSIVIQKFGGSSVANLENLKLVSEHIISEIKKGNKVVAVVSAQGKTTDKLISEEKEISINAPKREHDVLVSVGEQITIAKLAILLNSLGYSAISLTGWQIPIVTDSNFTNSTILRIDTNKIKELFGQNDVLVIAGFQGVDEYGNITTLGRGGSDITALALAESLKIDTCYIYTDVDGIFDKDPLVHLDAKKYQEISYDEMLRMAQNGAKVLQFKCVEIGKRANVKIIVKSTFLKEGNGTIVK